MGGFWSSLGTGIAQQSPVGRAAYQAVTGQVLPPPQGQQPNPGDALANSIIGRYKRAPQDQNASSPAMGQPMPPSMPGSGPIDDHESPAQPTQWNSDPAQSGTNPFTSLMNSAAGGSATAAGTNALEGLAVAQKGMVAGGPTMARIAERGPEMAGGQIVSKPSIVKLDKGDTVVPMTARPGNKMQPDLLVGRGIAPKVPGVSYSRYKSFGSGRGLMR